jgi:hypothetical protein
MEVVANSEPLQQVKGKDMSGSSLGNKLSMSHEYAFKAPTPQDAQKWWETLRSVTGSTTNELPTSSPSESRQASSTLAPSTASAEEDTTTTTASAETAALEAERKEAAHAAAGSNDGVATGSKVV